MTPSVCVGSYWGSIGTSGVGGLLQLSGLCRDWNLKVSQLSGLCTVWIIHITYVDKSGCLYYVVCLREVHRLFGQF
jgi:hypothetical protein